MAAESPFPQSRLRRLRYHSAVRRLVQSTRLVPANLVWPLFVRFGTEMKHPIASMPGNFQWSVDMLEGPLREAVELRLGGVILFGIPEQRDATGTQPLSGRARSSRANKYFAYWSAERFTARF